MSAIVARGIVHLAAAVIPDRDTRARYREQWLADVGGAAEVGMTPLPLALGALVAAASLASNGRGGVATLVAPLRLPMVSGRVRRAVGVVQLLMAAPYLWATALYAYARLSLGVSDAELFSGAHPPVDVLADVFRSPLTYPPPMFPLAVGAWAYTPVMLWFAVGGWAFAATLAPVGALLAIGGQRWQRWLPAIGTILACATSVVGLSSFGEALRIWLLD